MCIMKIFQILMISTILKHTKKYQKHIWEIAIYEIKINGHALHWSYPHMADPSNDKKTLPHRYIS